MPPNTLDATDSSTLDVIEEAIQRAYTATNPKIVNDWHKFREAYEKTLSDLRKEIDQLGEKVQKLAEPPLQYAIFLGRSAGAEREIVVGAGNTRLEVHVADNIETPVEELTAGREVVLNKEQNVVAFRDEYARGDTAEVVNILRPDDSAEILAVIEPTPQQPRQLRVKWRESEEKEVSCAHNLHTVKLERGDVVQLNADQSQAVAKLRPRLHVRTGGSEGTVVEISDRLFDQGVKIGDIVRIEPGLKFAFEKLPTYETGELTLEEVPDVTYDDIGGLDNQIEEIYDAIELPYLFRPQFERYQLTRPKGILLYGPPGCGKTMVAKAVANNLTQSIRDHLTGVEKRILLFKKLKVHPKDKNLIQEYLGLLTDRSTANELAANLTADTMRDELTQFFQLYNIDPNHLDSELEEIRTTLTKKDGVRSFFLNVKGPELLDKYVGETEHRIRKIFEEARRHASYYTPVVIFFDEMEAMFRTRGTGRSSDIETTIVPQFLSEMDGVESADNLIVIGASNRHDMIDPGILRPGRLDVKIKVERPSREAAQDILALYLLPTLPLCKEGVTIPAQLESLGEVVFRTAYRVPDNAGHRSKISTGIDAVCKLLPPQCDLRLARSLRVKDLEKLAQLPPKTTVRDALALQAEDDPIRAALRRFRLSALVEDIVSRRRLMDQELKRNPGLRAMLDEYLCQEWIAEAMLRQAVSHIYNPASVISVLVSSGNRHTFPLREFTSGATLANIVTRAKKRAIKRVVLDRDHNSPGLALDDMLVAVREEFDENKEQYAEHKVHSELGRPDEQVQSVELIMETSEADPWSEEKLRPYKTAAQTI